MTSSHTRRPLAVTLASVFLLTACGTADRTTANVMQPAAPASAATTPVPVANPAPGATSVAAGTDIQLSAPAGPETAVVLRSVDGAAVGGSFQADRRAWRPAHALAYATTYQVQVGSSTVTTFTTMAKPSRTVRATSYLGDNHTVGVAMPLILTFDQPIAKAARPAVQRRLSVTAQPAQTGAWSWISDTEIHYRPRAYWQPGTSITYRAQLGGVPMGEGRYGRADLSVAITVGRKLEIKVDDSTKQMTVLRDNRIVKVLPVSMGKDSTPTSSGTTVIMEKKKDTVFDTTDELGPTAGYRIPVKYAQRLTVGGQFIHKAEWSEKDQGKRNVSHGCVNVSESSGAWLFGQTLIGDPVTVRGTSRTLASRDGWTEWNQSWNEFTAGSALPAGKS